MFPATAGDPHLKPRAFIVENVGTPRSAFFSVITLTFNFRLGILS